ncbi:MAG: POT family proton-dependent oligopeptide transporter [Bradymonadia bacterium]|jgi:POT family proton-dependent oligopeptide transporter
MPSGIPFIISNEAAERFSFYGMKTILVIFMTQYLMGSNGDLDPMSEDQAKAWYHTFTSLVYYTPIAGAILSDWFLGKYKTILLLSVVYCLGHFTLALDETRLGLGIGLTLIAVGAGGIKPCVSAHVGDQFGPSNKDLVEKVFYWFYFSINFGSLLSTLLTPWLLQKYGPSVAFGVPGVLMALATFLFWLGRNRFIHVPPGGSEFIKQTFSRTGLEVMARLFGIYIFVAMFWALFDQTGSSWVLQAQYMDLNFGGHTWLPSQVQALNPIMILAFIPLFSLLIYPAINKVFPLTPLRKIGIGFFITVIAFLVPAYIESQIPELARHWHAFMPSWIAYPEVVAPRPNVVWHILAYAILTAAEVLVSITALEFSYTQAPHKMKSIVMALFLVSVGLGNTFAAAVNFIIANDDGTSKLDGPAYFLFFAACMFVTALLFTVYSRTYKGRSYIQGEDVT